MMSPSKSFEGQLIQIYMPSLCPVARRRTLHMSRIRATLTLFYRLVPHFSSNCKNPPWDVTLAV